MTTLAFLVLLAAAGPGDAAQASGSDGPSPLASETIEPRRNYDFLIGRTYVSGTSPAPSLQYRGRTVLVDSADLWMTVFKTPARRYVLVTERLARRTASGQAVWRILDTATGATVEGPNGYWAPPSWCRRGGSDLPRVVGVARGRDPYYNPAVQIWRFTSPGGRLLVGNRAGVTCFTGNPD